MLITNAVPINHFAILIELTHKHNLFIPFISIIFTVQYFCSAVQFHTVFTHLYSKLKSPVYPPISLPLSLYLCLFLFSSCCIHFGYSKENILFA